MHTAKLTLALAVMTPLAAYAQQGGIRLSALNHNFVSVPQGATEKYGVKVTNETGSAFPFSLTLTGSPNYRKFTNCPDSLAPAASCEMIFVYTAPKDSTAWEEGDFEIAANGVPFTPGNKGWLRAHPVPAGEVSFNSIKHNFLEVKKGDTGSGASGPFGLQISNGTSEDIPVSVQPTGDTSDFTVTPNCPATVKAGGQCTVTIAFQPKSDGWKKVVLAVQTGSAKVENEGKIELIGAGK